MTLLRFAEVWSPSTHQPESKFGKRTPSPMSRTKPRRAKSGTSPPGPSGAPIWSSPAIDAKNNALYATTGDNYSDPTSRMSDAFMAFDLDTGKILWSRQMTPPTHTPPPVVSPTKPIAPIPTVPISTSAPGRFSSR